MRVIGENVKLRVIEEEGKLPSGIVIPNEVLNIGFVVDLGEKIDDINVGDMVFFTKYALSEEKTFETEQGREVVIHYSAINLIIKQ